MTAPLQVLMQAQTTKAPNFRRVSPPCCYHCKFSEFSKEDVGFIFKCGKYEIPFGLNEHESAHMMAEFCCDDFEEGF